MRRQNRLMQRLESVADEEQASRQKGMKVGGGGRRHEQQGAQEREDQTSAQNMDKRQNHQANLTRTTSTTAAEKEEATTRTTAFEMEKARKLSRRDRWLGTEARLHQALLGRVRAERLAEQRKKGDKKVQAWRSKQQKAKNSTDFAAEEFQKFVSANEASTGSRPMLLTSSGFEIA